VTRNSGRHGDDRATEREQGLRIRLFDADRTDKDLSFAKAMKARVSSRQLLWIDVEGDLQAEHLRAMVERFGFDAETEEALGKRSNKPHLQLHGQHFHLCVAAEPHAERPEDIRWLDILGGPNVVISVHPEPLDFVEEMDERIATDATIGELDSSAFVASVLEGIVTSYHAAVDRLEDELDVIDAKALSKKKAPANLFDTLVAIRQRVGRLRRLFAAHRVVFSAIGGPDFAQGVSSAEKNVFTPVSNRFDGVLLSIEATREVVRGSVDILLTRTAQRTNDVMKVLTVATVMFLPATVTAGFMGMNVIVPVPNDDPASFWIILGVVLVFEVAVVVIARWRGWL
jgi:Mg2+ and Co2+ transporter CorA